MHKLFIIFLVVGTLSCTSQRPNNNTFIIKQDNKNSLCKTMTRNNWVTFDSITTKDFSESFKARLSEKLNEKLCDLLENKVSGPEFNFLLNIGSPVYQVNENNNLITKPFEITVNENYAFANTGLTTAFAQLYNVTIAWSSPDFTNPIDIHKNDVTNKQLDFYWCNDFPKDEIIKSLAPSKTKLKSESGYKFDVIYHLRVFPDVAIYFDFNSKPTAETLEELHSEVIKFRDKYKTVYVHEMTEHNGLYLIPINHNTINYDTYTDKDYEKDVNNFDFLLKNIDSNSKIIGLNKITLQ